MSYTLSPDGKSITCLTCRLTSYNLNDVAQRYCGNCKVFLDPVDEAYEFDCRECGRHIVSLCDPYRRDVCALCTAIPGWCFDLALASRLDPDYGVAFFCSKCGTLVVTPAPPLPARNLCSDCQPPDTS